MADFQHLVGATAVAAALTMTSISARQEHGGQHDKRTTVGHDVTLTSCVERGTADDTFVLTQVADVPVHPPTLGRVVYWLDKKDDLKKHVGHQIRVKGQITEVTQSEMEIKAGDDREGGGWFVEIEGPGKDVRTPAANVGVAAGTPDAREIKTTLVKLKVSEVSMLAASCPAR